MKNNACVIIVLLMIISNGCDENSVKNTGSKEVLVSQGFVDDNTYRVVCRGYPLEGLTGIQQSESSKRAALLSAYYYIGQVFNDSVAPDRDGKSEKIEYMSDHALLYYVVTKKGLKKRVRTGPKTETDAGPKTQTQTEKKSEAATEAQPGTKTELQ